MESVLGETAGWIVRSIAQFVNGWITIFGPSPVAGGINDSRIYRAAFRDCGELQVLDMGPGSTQMALAGLSTGGQGP